MSKKVFGIDLGTTYSCISVVDEYGRPEVIRNFDSDATTPSVVLFESADQHVVGKQAKRQARIDPDHVATLVKRHMGEADWRFAAHGRDWSAAAVSALILKKLADDAQLTTGTPVENVVITVPAYFGDEERKATKLAGEHAGLTVVDIINEPTAAAFAYGFAQQGSGSETVLVYDLGGGTFDITIIHLDAQTIRVVATEGDHELGGADWDERVATELSERFQAEAPGAEDPLDDSVGARDLIEAAEQAKQALSLRDSTDVLVIHGAHRANVTLTREGFEQLTATLLDRTLELTRRAIAAAQERGVTQIDRVLLVGGSSKMPAVARRLKEDLGLDGQLADPDLAVATGAALFGQKKELEALVHANLPSGPAAADADTVVNADPAELERAVDAAAQAAGLGREAVRGIVLTKVQNVVSRGFGIRIQDDATGTLSVHFLTHRNDPLPVEVAQTFGTAEDNQTDVRIGVFEQGGGEESPRLEDNNLLIEGTISGIPPGLPKGTEVSVLMRMGGDGVLEVTARHAAVDQPLSLRVETGTRQSDEEIAAERQAVSLMKARN